MNLISKILFLMLICVVLGACAFTPQTAVIKPDIDLAETDEGHNATVTVKVVDERPDDALGHRGAAFKGAKITASQDIEDLFRKEIMQGLAKKGFKPTNCGKDSKPNLKVEIRLLEYSTSMGFFTGGIHTKVTLKAVADVNGQTYENLYRVENEKRVMFVPTASANEKYLNQVVSDILTKLFQDQELITTLAKL
jgi:uncharacterized lipoprotein YajG